MKTWIYAHDRSAGHDSIATLSYTADAPFTSTRSPRTVERMSTSSQLWRSAQQLRGSRSAPRVAALRRFRARNTLRESRFEHWSMPRDPARFGCFAWFGLRATTSKLQLADDFRASPPLYSTKFLVRQERPHGSSHSSSGFDSSPRRTRVHDIMVATRSSFHCAPLNCITLQSCRNRLVLYLVLGSEPICAAVAAKTDELVARSVPSAGVWRGQCRLFDWDLQTTAPLLADEASDRTRDDETPCLSEWQDRSSVRSRACAATVADASTALPRIQSNSASATKPSHDDPSPSGRFDTHVRWANCGSHVDITDRSARSVCGRPGAVHDRARALRSSSRSILLRVVERNAGSRSILLSNPTAACATPAAPSLPVAFCRAIDANPRRRRRVVRDRHFRRSP